MLHFSSFFMFWPISKLHKRSETRPIIRRYSLENKIYNVIEKRLIYRNKIPQSFVKVCQQSFSISKSIEDKRIRQTAMETKDYRIILELLKRKEHFGISHYFIITAEFFQLIKFSLTNFRLIFTYEIFKFLSLKILIFSSLSQSIGLF